MTGLHPTTVRADFLFILNTHSSHSHRGERWAIIASTYLGNGMNAHMNQRHHFTNPNAKWLNSPRPDEPRAWHQSTAFSNARRKPGKRKLKTSPVLNKENQFLACAPQRQQPLLLSDGEGREPHWRLLAYYHPTWEVFLTFRDTASLYGKQM